MDNLLKVSVIIPVYKVEKYLDKCVESVVNQSYKNLEIILVDDGSPDNCPQMCDEWAKKDNRIKVIHKENGGVSSARNKGLEIAKGEYIQFVDSDDYLETTYTEKLVSGFEQAECDLSCGGYKIVTLKSKVKYFDSIKYKGINILKIKEKFLKFIIDGLFDVTVNKLFKMSYVRQIYFDESLPLGEDRKFILDYLFLMNGKINFVDTTGYIYVYNNNSAIHKQRINAYEILYESFDYLMNFYKKKFDGLYCEEYYSLIGGFVSSVLRITPKKYYKETINKINKMEYLSDYIKYKPLKLKQKIKHYLIKHKMYKILNFLSRIINK